MRADGTVRAAFRPKHVAGRPPGTDVKAAPDGRLWTCDGYALLRLDDAGVVDRVLGDAPDPERLGEIEALEVDRAGRIYAIDKRTRSVHVFDPQGRWLRVCVPSPSDFDGNPSLSQLTVSDEGHVYLSLGGAGGGRNGQHIHFSPDGNRRGIDRLDLDEISQDWYSQPGTGHRWVVAYEKIFLVDRAGGVLKTIERCPDRKWLEHPARASVAPDGSLAVLARGAVNLYGASGEPIRTIPLPAPLRGTYARITYDGKRIAIAEDKAIVLLDASGQARQRFSPVETGGGDPYWSPFFAPGGRELLLFDGRRTIVRHELP
jgi:hypothetical protein